MRIGGWVVNHWGGESNSLFLLFKFLFSGNRFNEVDTWKFETDGGHDW